MHLQFAADPRNKVESIVRSVLNDIKGFAVTLRMWTTGGNVDVALSTDLDDQITSKLKGVIGAEFTKLQNDLKGKLEARIAEKRKEFDQLYAAKRDAAEKQLAA